MNQITVAGDVKRPFKFEFATDIQVEALALGLLDKEISIMPIRTSQYPTPAKRPAYTVVDCSNTWNDFSISPVHWRISLNELLSGILTIFLREL